MFNNGLNERRRFAPSFNTQDVVRRLHVHGPYRGVRGVCGERTGVRDNFGSYFSRRACEYRGCLISSPTTIEVRRVCCSGELV